MHDTSLAASDSSDALDRDRYATVFADRLVELLRERAETDPVVRWSVRAVLERWESYASGARRMGYDTLATICGLLGVSVPHVLRDVASDAGPVPEGEDAATLHAFMLFEAGRMLDIGQLSTLTIPDLSLLATAACTGSYDWPDPVPLLSLPPTADWWSEYGRVFGAQVHAVRRARRLSTSDLRERAVRGRDVTSYEAGELVPLLVVTASYADALKVNMIELLTQTDRCSVPGRASATLSTGDLLTRHAMASSSAAAARAARRAALPLPAHVMHC